MRSYLRAPGVHMAPLGEGWAAYSSLSSETHLLNVESVAVVDALDLWTPRSAPEVAALLAEDSGVDAGELLVTLSDAWAMLVEAGLIREHGATACSPA